MPDLELSIWKRGVNFQVFSMEKLIENKVLKQKIGQYLANTDIGTSGWYDNSPLFSNTPLNSNKEDVACYIYLIPNNLKALNNNGTKALSRKNIPNYRSVACTFYFTDNLVIVSLIDQKKLATEIDQEAFRPVKELTKCIAHEYSTDFLFWLLYRQDVCNKIITDNISIEYIYAFSSDDKHNLTNAIHARKNVTNFFESKLILALRGNASGVKIIVKNNSIPYNFTLFYDGRISLKDVKQNITGIEKADINTGNAKELIDEIKEKSTIAKDVHKLIGECYSEYKKIKDTKEWIKAKDLYRRDLHKTVAANSMKDAISIGKIIEPTEYKDELLEFAINKMLLPIYRDTESEITPEEMTILKNKIYELLKISLVIDNIK